MVNFKNKYFLILYYERNKLKHHSNVYLVFSFLFKKFIKSTKKVIRYFHKTLVKLHLKRNY